RRELRHVRAARGALAQAEIAERFVEASPDGAVAEDPPRGDQILLQSARAGEVAGAESVIKVDGEVRAEGVRSTHRAVTSQLQACQRKKLASRENTESRIRSHQLNHGLQIDLIGIAHLDAYDAGNTAAQFGDGLRLN